MYRANNRIVCFLLIVIVVSCGPKKGIVTKKKDSRPVAKIDAPKAKVNVPSTVTKKSEGESKGVIRAGKKSTGSLVEDYIANYAEIAKAEMQKYRIPASITLAQGILESGSGNGRLAKEANNHFGIKCHGWTGAKIYHDDDRSQECFRKYNEPFLSYEDHSKFLTERGRYAFLFDLKQDDYKAWARGLKKAGYATDRNYPKKLIGLIERYELYHFDDEVLSKRKGSRRANKKQKQEGLATVEKITHEVKQGETLYSLSIRYKTTVESIIKLNDLPNSNIKIGQVLVITKKR